MIQPDSSHGYSLFFLVRELDRIYHDVGKVLESIARCFLAHQKNWVHLVTLTNRPIEDRTNFIKTYGPLIQHAIHEDTPPQKGHPSREEQIQRVRIRNELNSILVRVNPAGFTYVRHILPHFEFYANLAKNRTSLFDDPLALVDEDNKVYAFTTKIDTVYELVQKHVESMRLFYDTRYVKAGIAKDFPGSDFAFRHPGTARVARPKGYSHTIRITTAHIGYIDYFRRALLDPENLFAGVPLDEEERRRINRLLLARLRRYIALLRQAPDAEAANAQADEFERVIRGIANNGYTDMKTSVTIDGTS